MPDCRLGIKLTKGAIRLFTDPYQSDIIISSPIAMVSLSLTLFRLKGLLAACVCMP